MIKIIVYLALQNYQCFRIQCIGITILTSNYMQYKKEALQDLGQLVLAMYYSDQHEYQ